jgi:hypothetical protein
MNNNFTGIKGKKDALDLLRISGIVLRICSFYCLSISVGATFIIGITTFLNYSLVNFIIFGIPWSIIFGIFAYKASMSAYYFSGYFSIMCYYLKQRLNSIRKRLEIMPKSLSSDEKILRISRILDEHNDICQQIFHYNKYWKKFLTLNYSIFLLIICILSYVVFISPELKWPLRLEYSIILSAHLLFLFVTTYSASTVSHFNLILNRDLHSFCSEKHLTIDNKFKVRLKKILINKFKN